jgi:hypothetical protein
MSASASVRPACAERHRGKLRIRWQQQGAKQFSGWIEIRTILPILVMADVEMCSNCAFLISRSRHIDHAAETWQSAATLLDYLLLPDCTPAALEQNYTFCFNLLRALRLCTFHSPKHTNGSMPPTLVSRLKRDDLLRKAAVKKQQDTRPS